MLAASRAVRGAAATSPLLGKCILQRLVHELAQLLQGGVIEQHRGRPCHTRELPRNSGLEIQHRQTVDTDIHQHCVVLQVVHVEHVLHHDVQPTSQDLDGRARVLLLHRHLRLRPLLGLAEVLGRGLEGLLGPGLPVVDVAQDLVGQRLPGGVEGLLQELERLASGLQSLFEVVAQEVRPGRQHKHPSLLLLHARFLADGHRLVHRLHAVVEPHGDDVHLGHDVHGVDDQRVLADLPGHGQGVLCRVQGLVLVLGGHLGGAGRGVLRLQHQFYIRCHDQDLDHPDPVADVLHVVLGQAGRVQ
mmetsp:Transcript_32366/g.43868  ORF Transcript_32366/g.43868 Transcript_32366/m.43868 type:complete len:302 (+) Transcript_32366:118-1023(+)